MDHDKKMAFLQNMTHLALTHAASVPNVATPSGGMSHDKMLEFVRKVAEKGIEHMSLGGTLGKIVPTGGFGGAASKVLGTTNNFTPQQAAITPGTNSDQLNTAYQGAQGALGQQQGVANTLTGQLNQGADTQGQLSQMLMNEAQGQGPNPAQAQLNQNTGQNIAQQAALMAGQRGAGTNAGLLATQAAQQGAATQQQAVGQGATLGAQQQLAAQGQLQSLAGTQVGQGQAAVQGVNNAQQNEQNILQGANTANNSANLANAASANNVGAQIAIANQNANANATSGLLGAGAALAPLAAMAFAKGGIVKMDKGGNILDANARKHIAPHNFALPGGRYPIHDESHARNALARVSQNGSSEEKAKVRAAVHKKYPHMGKKMAMGGEVKNLSKQPSKENPFKHDSKFNTPPPRMMAEGGMAGPQSFVGNWLNSNSSYASPQIEAPVKLNTNVASPFAGASMPKMPGSKDPGLRQPGSTDMRVAGGSADSVGGIGAGAGGDAGGLESIMGTAGPAVMAANKGGLMKSGGKVVAHSAKEKAKVSGDSLKNDEIPTMLSEGELVIPRHIMQHPNAPAMAAQFVAQQLSKRGKK